MIVSYFFTQVYLYYINRIVTDLQGYKEKTKTKKFTKSQTSK